MIGGSFKGQKRKSWRPTDGHTRRRTVEHEMRLAAVVSAACDRWLAMNEKDHAERRAYWDRTNHNTAAPNPHWGVTNLNRT